MIIIDIGRILLRARSLERGDTCDFGLYASASVRLLRLLVESIGRGDGYR